MKKLVFLLLAVCTCISVVVMLTACHRHTFSDEWTYNETHHWKAATCKHTTKQSEYGAHSLTNDKCVCGYVATRYTVEDSEWNDLFASEGFSNVTLYMEHKYYHTGETEPEIENRFLKKTETAICQGDYDTNGNTIGSEDYYTCENEKWYYVRKWSTNEWVGREVSYSEVANYDISTGIGMMFADMKSLFTYDDENKCYLLENFSLYDDETAAFKLYFKNGKLIKIEGTIIDPTGTNSFTYTFTDYGTTVIDVPDWTLEPDNDNVVDTPPATDSQGP